jgi:proline iminopeptidase
MAAWAFFAALSGCQALSTDDPGALVPPTVDEDPGLPYLDLNGTRLHVETFGDPDRDAMIFLHGGPGDNMEYMRGLSDLSDRFFCVFFDQRGAGRSRREQMGSYEEFRDSYLGDLEAIVDRYSRPGRRLILVGHSWGGQYIAWYLNRRPDAPIQAVLIDPGPLTSAMYASMGLRGSEFDWRRLSGYMDLNQTMSPGSHARLDYSLMVAKKAIKAFERYHLGSSQLYANSRMGGLAIMRSSASGSSFDETANLARVSCRVVFIRSGWNEVHTEDYMQAYMAYFSGADRSYVTIPEVGHDVVQVKRAELESAILGNLR